jgi:transcriptional regulator with XRE-family HTH domain
MVKASQVAKKDRTSNPVPTLDVCVARRIVRLRQEKNLTQDKLARLCGLSPAYLSRVESNQAALTLSGLARVAAALEIPATALLDEEESFAPLSLHRSHGKMKLLRSRGSHSHQMLATDKKGKLMEPLLVDVSRKPSTGRQWAHAGEEFDYLLEGTCTFFYGKERFTLHAGDAVYYDASVPHGIVRTSASRARLLVVVSARDYLFHGDIQRLLRTNVGARRNEE